MGDVDFREKSAARTLEMMNGGCAVLLVSHDLEAVQKMSTRAIYLSEGSQKIIGRPHDVIDAYLSDVHH